MEFELTLRAEGRGLLWALWKIHSDRVTGVLSLTWDRYKKQILFRSGEPVSVASNWPQEAFGQFLIRQKKITPADLASALESSNKLGEALVVAGKIPGSEMPDLIQAHFRDRLFNLLTLTHGKLVFQQASDDQAQNFETTRLSDTFSKLLYESAKSLFDTGFCRSRLAGLLHRPGRVTGALPLSVPPKDLRLWNDLQKDEREINKLDETSLFLMTLAHEFGLSEWGEDPNEKLMRELKERAAQQQKAKAHEVLGVEPSADTALCRKAYLELTKKFHPDRLPPTATAEVRALSQEVFAKINEAHSTMTDPEKRKEYEAALELEKSGGVERIQAQLKAEMLIPQAKAALKRRHFQFAVESFREILPFLPDDAEIVADAAFSEFMLEFEKKKDARSAGLSKARQQIERALSLRENYAPAYYYLGLMAKMDGQTARALQYFDQALQNDSRLNEAASEARHLRTQLKKERGKGGLFGSASGPTKKK